MKILLVEDDKSLGSTLTARLEKEGYSLNWVRSATEAVKTLTEDVYDLAIFDVGLPDGDGFELVEKIPDKRNLPVIFLTAMDSAEYRLRGYELGADEYIPKPFHLKELLIRIKKVLEGYGLSDLKNCGDFSIDFESRAILFPDGTKELPSTRDFSLLTLLVKTAPAVVSREDMIKKISLDDKLSTQRTVDNSIVRLRQHLGSTGKNYIRSIRGVGYQWVEKE